MDITFYGLLHLAKGEKSSVNGGLRKFDRQIETYLMNAVNLSDSLQSKDIEFILLTNQPAAIEDSLNRLGSTDRLKVQSINFSTDVPTGINFYSAHFKIDVFNYLGSLPADRYVGLIDLDTIAIGEITLSFQNLIREKTPIVYDITNQVIPIFGRDRILQDMQKLWPNITEVRWMGGEFITGTPGFFNSLYSEIGKLYNRYIEAIDSLHHHGDEMLASVALAKLTHEGKIAICDGGELDIVGRFWSYPPKHSQPSFSCFENLFLLHLPSDKKFLAKINYEDAKSRDRFLQKYKRYLPQQLAVSSVHNKIVDLLKWMRLK
jgi:hypothetical protein